ncbi:MAG TPA: hypothetical protein VHZ07_13960 [Bryobacteraceae bacterium]|jgi:hypothetical protein|nr:hypothetical protein [Bryobacteraceae bacterium]
MKSSRVISFLGIIASLTSPLCLPHAYGQGCIVARSNGEQGGPATDGGYLTPGDFEFGIGYRHQFSFIHFVGPTEQTYRVQQGTQVENKINLENIYGTYQISSRFSVTADVPLLTASRHTNDSPIIYTSSGIGDSSLLVQGWVWNPKEETSGNIQLGFGVLFPTGKDNVQNTVFSNGKMVTAPVDYSIQPGQGAWGIPLEWSAFKNWRSSQLYFNGSYTMMTKDLGALRSTSVNPVTLTQYNAVSDQYLLEGGVAHPFHKVRGLAVLFGPRMEGVPARNLLPIGDNLGFRRPGFAVSVEPGIQYVRDGNMFSFTIARAIYRDRTRSVPDDLTGGHGDAAFANWVWLATYTFRVKHADTVHELQSHRTQPAH